MMFTRIRFVCLLLIVVPGLVFGQYGRPRRDARSGLPTVLGQAGGDVPRALRSIDKRRSVIDAGEDRSAF